MCYRKSLKRDLSDKIVTATPSPPIKMCKKHTLESSGSTKLTKSEAKARVRQTMKNYSASQFVSSTDDKFKLRFKEGINQLTFEDDDRFLDENIIFGDDSRVKHKHIRDLGCEGRTTHVKGQRLQVGDNVEANFKGKGRWYPAQVTKVYRGRKYDLQYTGVCDVDVVCTTTISNCDLYCYV